MCSCVCHCSYYPSLLKELLFGYFTGVPQPPDLMESDISAASVTVTWNVLSDVEIDHYLIQYRVKIGNPEWMEVTVPSSPNSHAITGLSPRTTYEVRIFAVSTDGVTSVAADPITITTESMFLATY